jgi:hypothetical protein
MSHGRNVRLGTAQVANEQIFLRNRGGNTMNSYMTVGLSMLAGAALGGAAIQTLHAQAKPHAYVIGEVTIKIRTDF